MAARDAAQPRSSAIRPARVQRSPFARRTALKPWLFLAPLLASLLIVAAWPLLRTILFSLTDANLSDLTAWKFIGIANYLYLFEDPLWWRAVGNTLLFTLLSVGLETILGLIIALTLDAHLKGRGLLRAAILIPWAIPTVVSAKMWAWMLHDQYGVVNAMLLAFGLIDRPYAWLADPSLTMAAVVMVDVWKSTPFMALLILAGLQALPQSIYEAARVDGIHPVKVFFHITLPLIRPALLVAVIFRGLDALRVFDVIYVLTGNNENTATMSVYARQQLVDFQDVGFGSAAATALFLIVAIMTAIVVTLGRVNVSASGGDR
ncbi:carbohydrate ABC transporter permease [Taklimakanibacter deserti]|uniref:carbohydrate ABC transporter permease n=1 Tax=Taklimakanibacter deserti TaxID=2267839 RepID=UPI000E648099